MSFFWKGKEVGGTTDADPTRRQEIHMMSEKYLTEHACVQPLFDGV